MDIEKNINRCKQCNCKCHCKQEMHADVYGPCTCDTCQCEAPVNEGEECLSCQQRIFPMKKLKDLWQKYVDWVFKDFYK